jgi:hypothetical protein
LYQYCSFSTSLSFVEKRVFIAMIIVLILFLVDKFISLSLGKLCLLPCVLYQYRSFSTSLFVFRWEKRVYCHEWCTSTVPCGQVYLSFLRKWMFIAMSIVPVLFFLDKFICLLDWSLLRLRNLRMRLLLGSNTTCPLEYCLKNFLNLWRWCLPKLWQCLTAY